MNKRIFVLVLFMVLLLCSGISCGLSLLLKKTFSNLKSGYLPQSNFIQQPVVRTPTIGACNVSLNPFIKTLVDQGVILNTGPVKNTTKCGDEWKTYGTCCQEASLVQFAIADSNEFKDNSKRFVGELGNLIKAIRVTVFKIVGKEEKIQKKKNIFHAVASKIGGIIDMVGKLVERVKDFNMLKKAFNEERKDIVKHQSVCVKKLTDLRSASLCNTCSSRSAIFFQGQRAIIQMSTCKEVIELCHNYWTSVIKLIDTSFKSRKLVNHAMKFLQMPKTTSIDYLAKWLTETNLRQVLDGCSSPEKCKDEQASLICGSLITIKGKQNIATQTSSFLGDQVKSFKTLMDTFDPLNKIKPPENDTDRRLLGELQLDWNKQNENFKHGVFGDVVTVPDRFGSNLHTPMNLDAHLP